MTTTSGARPDGATWRPSLGSLVAGEVAAGHASLRVHPASIARV
ncbi:hypothetical protein VQ042_14335 [Aurantimonas sp. A2-1-M11]